PRAITLSAANGDLTSVGDVSSTGGSNGGVSLTTTGGSHNITLGNGATYYNALTTSGNVTANATGNITLLNASSTNGDVTLSTPGSPVNQTQINVQAAAGNPAVSGGNVTL